MVAVEAVDAAAEEVATTTMMDLNGEVEEIEEDEVVVEAVAAKMASHTALIPKMKPMQSNNIKEVGAEAEGAVETSISMNKEDRTNHVIKREEKATIKDNSVSILNKRSEIAWQETRIRIN